MRSDFGRIFLVCLWPRKSITEEVTEVFTETDNETDTWRFKMITEAFIKWKIKPSD